MFEDTELEYYVKICKRRDNLYVGTVRDDFGIGFTTRKQKNKQNVINDVIVFVKLFIDFTMKNGNSKKIKNIKINKVEKFHVH